MERLKGQVDKLSQENRSLKEKVSIHSFSLLQMLTYLLFRFLRWTLFWRAKTRKTRASIKSTMIYSSSKHWFWRATWLRMELTSRIFLVFKAIRLLRAQSQSWLAKFTLMMPTRACCPKLWRLDQSTMMPLNIVTRFHPFLLKPHIQNLCNHFCCKTSISKVPLSANKTRTLWQIFLADLMVHLIRWLLAALKATLASLNL